MESINDHSEFNAVFTKDYDGTIRITQADKCFIKIIDASKECIGNDITQILNKTDASMIKYYFEQYQGRRYYTTLIREHCGALLLIDAVICFNSINITGTIIDYSNNLKLSMNGLENESEAIVNSYIIACGRIKKVSGLYLFSDINESLVMLMRHNRISRETILHSGVFLNCMKRHLSSAGIISHREKDKEYYYIAGFYPIIYQGMVRELQFFIIPFESSGLENEEVLEQLTPRESTILRLSAEGFDIPKIASCLNISDSTVKTIFYSSFRKINVRTKTEAILKFYGLLRNE